MKNMKELLAVTTFVLTIGCGHNIAMAAAENSGETMKDVYGYIGSELVEKPTSIEVLVKNFSTEDITKLVSSEGLQSYSEEDGTNYDYAVYNIKTLNYTSKVVTEEGQSYCKVKLYPTYRETRTETAYVFTRVAEIINSNSQVYSLKTAEKYEWIYDYIMANVSYDYTMTNQTAYAALTSGTTICGGYSSLYYAFATELGLPSRIAYGIGNGIYHAWNLVQLDGSWYCVDSTMGDYPGYRDSYLFRAMSYVSSHNIDDGFEVSLDLATMNYAMN